MSDSRRARTVRRLTGGVLLAVCFGLAIERAGAQQQGSAGANVNVISGTGADGDWTLQRQNEPTMACSSRNPQNCLAGANDYRTVDIPFPTIGEKITGDAWLGWYTTKNGGLTWRTRLLPGYPQDASPAGIASPLKGYPAGADPDHPFGHERDVLLRRPRLQSRRRRGQRDLRRAVHRQQQPGRHRRRADRVHRHVGCSPNGRRTRCRAQARVEAIGRPRASPARARAKRERARTGTRARAERGTGAADPTRAPSSRAGPSRWSTSPGWRSTSLVPGATMCTVGGPGTGIPLQTFPGGRVYMAYALFDGPGEERGRIMFSRTRPIAA